MNIYIILLAIELYQIFHKKKRTFFYIFQGFKAFFEIEIVTYIIKRRRNTKNRGLEAIIQKQVKLVFN